MNILSFKTTKPKRCFKPFFCFWVAATLIALLGTEVFAAGHWEEVAVTQDLGTYSFSMNIDMWHYSGGYWKAGINSGSSTIPIELTDAQLDGVRGIMGYINSNYYSQFVADIPDELEQYLKSGWKLSLGLPSSFFNSFTKSSVSAKVSGGKVLFYAKPILNVSSDDFDDYISGLLVSIPLVDIKYGRNLYAVWKDSTEMGKGYGYYDENKKTAAATNYIHPLMIKDYTGKFKNNFQINYGGKVYKSDEYSVGYGTFQNGGAVGMLFNYSFNLHLTAKGTEQVWVEDPDPYVPPVIPEEPSESDNPDGPGDTPGTDPNTPGAIQTPAAATMDWLIHRVK